jgi:hypothetical protein
VFLSITELNEKSVINFVDAVGELLGREKGRKRMRKSNKGSKRTLCTHGSAKTKRLALYNLLCSNKNIF